MKQWIQVQDKINRAVYSPTPEVWQKIETRLDSGKPAGPRHWWAWSGWAAAAVLLVMLVVSIPKNDDSNFVIETLEVPVHQKEMPHSLENWYQNAHPRPYNTTGVLMPNYRQIQKSPLVANQNS